MAYKHGVYVRENATSLTATIAGTAGLQVVVGTAPVNLAKDPAAAVNKPVLVNSFAEAVEAMGYSDDFAAYTLCQSMDAAFRVVGCAPLVLINVLDPAKHSVNLTEQTVQVNNKVAVLETEGVLLDGLTVKNGSSAMRAGTDYTAAFDDAGHVMITLIGSATASTLTVTGKKLDPSKVTAADIVGSVTASTGAVTGLEAVQQVYPMLGMTPGVLLAPGYSKDATVAAAMQAKCTALNGTFRCVCVCDVDSGKSGAKVYTAVKEKKEAAGLNDANCYAVWPCAKVGEKVYSGSAIVGAEMAYLDASNDDIPNLSVDNKAVAISAACLEDGTEVYLDQEQANVLNGAGVGTFLRMNGWRCWGSNTAAYPGNTDPKDRWINVRRFMNWAANTFILTYTPQIGQVMNRRLIESIVDSENVRGNSFVSRGICAAYSIAFNEDDNPTTDLLNGKITFRQVMTPFTPAEDIEDVIEFDPSALATALGG